MTKTTSLIGAALFLAATSAASAQLVRFEILDQSSSASDLSPDGQYVVGRHINGGGYRWSRADGYVLLGGEDAVAVSDDGSIVLGEILDTTTGFNEAAIWRADEGTWEQLPPAEEGTPCNEFLNSYELSADGTAATGLAWENCSGRGFLWREGIGTIQLDVLGEGGNRSSVLSADGTLLGGFAQGSFSRTPAVWTSSGAGQLLDPSVPNVVGEVNGISDDGTIIMGVWDGKAFTWEEGGDIELFSGTIPSWAAAAYDIADDGTIIGFDYTGTNRKAWIRPNGAVAVDLRTYLIGLGATGVPSSLQMVLRVSTSGNVSIGQNFFANGWIVNTCVPDITGDGIVGFDDLLAVLSTWGPCVGSCQADIDLDGMVGFADLLEVLSNWGPCP